MPSSPPVDRSQGLAFCAMEDGTLNERRLVSFLGALGVCVRLSCNGSFYDFLFSVVTELDVLNFALSLCSHYFFLFLVGSS